MDKLKPVLAQKFWILLGVGLVVSFVGWSMASGEMAATISKRTEEIKKARDATNIGDVQNETWQAAIGKINEEQALKVEEATYKLWQDEWRVMEWPESMIQYLRTYRGEMNDPVAMTVYRNDYPGAFEGVWRTVRPIRPYDQTGIVDFPKQRMLPQKGWGTMTPTYQEVWEAQEDLWLFKALLKSILAVNGGEEGTKLDASIHSIQLLRLMGGDRSTIDAAGGGDLSGGGDAGMMGRADYDKQGDGEMMGMPGSGMGGFGGGGSSGEAMGGNRGATSAEFKPEDEFGSAGGVASGGGGNMGSMMGGEADGMGGDPSGSQALSRERRYVDDDEAQPFQTRGFYLSVIMDHRRVPQLLCELTANEYSPFPVEIVRVQIARLNDDSPGGSQRLLGGMSGAMPGAGASAYAGGGPEMLAGEEDERSRGIGSRSFGGAFAGASMPGMTGGRMGGADPYLADPFMAQVAISGLMRIYRKASPPVLPGVTAPVAEPEAVPASVSDDPEPTTPPEGTPSEGAVPGNAPAAPAAPANEGAPSAPATEVPVEGTAPAANALPQ